MKKLSATVKVLAVFLCDDAHSCGDEAATTMLTVHMGDKIYGFYSRHALMGGTGSDKDPMIYYGYLEGYFDDKQHYST